MKKLLQLFVVGLMTLTVTACVGEVDDGVEETPEETGPVVIGAILPLTGDGAAYGVPMQEVAQVAIDKINEEGGIDGRELQFKWEDGKCNGKDAASAATKLINVDKVEIIYGAFCSSETLGAAPIAEAAGVVMLSPGSSSPDVTEAGDYIFRNYPSDSAQGVLLANYATDAGFEKIGMLTEENDYTLGIDKVFSETFVDNGGEIVSERFLATDTDFKTQITKLKGEGVDAVFINPQTPPKADLLLKQLQEQGVDAHLFANDVVMGYREGITQYPNLVENMVGAETVFNESHPDFDFLVNQYKANTGEEEVPYLTYASTSYDAVFLIKEGVEEVGNDADAFRDWLYGVYNWDGIGGSLSIDSNGDPEAGHVLKFVQGGKVVTEDELDGPVLDAAGAGEDVEVVE